jgi:hypothetical protein
MSKSYRQSGVSAVLEFSKGGAKVKNSSGVVEARNNGDSAYAVVRGADPVNANDLVTKQYLEAHAAIAVIGNIYDSGGSTPASTQFTGAGQEGKIAICNQSVGSFTIDYLYRLDTWNTDVATSTWTEIVPTEGMSINVTDASSGGTDTYLADHIYIYDADTTTWIAVGPAAADVSISKNLQAVLADDTSSPLACGTPSAANSVITKVIIKVTTAFDGTAPLLDIGISGTTDLYMDQTEIDLKTIGTYIVDLHEIDTGPTAIIATYVADSSTVGDANILIHYETPSS